MELYVKWLYQPLKGHSVWLESDWMKIEQTIFLVEDIEKNNRTKDIYIIDESNQTWTVKQLKKLLKKLEDEPTDLITYFDGNFNNINIFCSIVLFNIFYQKNSLFYLHPI